MAWPKTTSLSMATAALLILLLAAVTTANKTDVDELVYAVANNDDNNNDQPPIPMLPVSEYSRAHGVPELFPRIVGGSEAYLGEFPGKVSIQTRQGYHYCGGTIVDERHVVTAAHCFVDETTGRVTDPTLVQVMGNDLLITATGSASRQVRLVSHVFVHTQFSLITLVNDVAVLRVSVAFAMNGTTFQPTNITTVTPVDYTVCRVAGWGAVRENGTASARLLRIDVAVIPRTICNARDAYGGLVGTAMICAGSMLGGYDSCQGDSGGGLICSGLLAGVVSFGYGCARPNFPGVYTDLSRHTAFVASAIASNVTNAGVSVPTTTRPGGAATALSVPVYLVTLLTTAVMVAAAASFDSATSRI